MRIRKSNLIGTIVAAAALVAGAAGAQTFDQTVTDAFSKDGSVLSQIGRQRQLSTQDPDMIEARSRGGHGGSGHGGSGHGGNGHGGNGHGGSGHGGSGHDGGGQHHEGSRHDGRGPDWHGRDGAWGDHYHGRYGWGWDARGPLWLGWAFWSGAGSCRDWYLGRRSGCYADCGAELNACLASGADADLCSGTNVSCTVSCNYQYDAVWAPYWGACRF